MEKYTRKLHFCHHLLIFVDFISSGTQNVMIAKRLIATDIHFCFFVFQQAHDGPAGHALCEVPPEPVWPHHRARHHQQKPCEVQTQRPHRSARG